METTLYLQISAMHHHLVNLSGDRKLPKMSCAYFYPTTSKSMAVEEAVRKASIDKGRKFVMKMNVRSAFLSLHSRYRNRSNVDEYVIHSSDVERFNANIIGEIEVVMVVK